MNRKRIISFLLAVGLVTSCISTLTYADVEQEVLEAQAQYEEYQNSIDSATAEVISLNCEIEELLSEINSAETEVEDLNNSIKSNKMKIESLMKQIDENEKLKGRRLREFTKTNSSLSYLSVLFDSNNFNDFLSRMSAVAKLMRLDKEMIESLEADKKQVNALKMELENEKKSVEELLNSLEQDKSLVEKKKEQQEGVLNNLKLEQDKFGSEVLEVAEIKLLSAQEEMINNGGVSASAMRGVVSQLEAIRDNQLTMGGSISKANSLIDLANQKANELEEQERLEQERLEQERLAELKRQEEMASPSRGDVIYIPNGSGVTGQDIVTYAYNFLGRPYVWGAVGPDTFDCSGFTSYVYRHCAGIEITRTTYTQINVGTPVSYSEMQPGDLVFTYNNEHVGIYVGGGMYINATYPGSTIRVTPVTNFYAARRIL